MLLRAVYIYSHNLLTKEKILNFNYVFKFIFWVYRCGMVSVYCLIVHTVNKMYDLASPSASVFIRS